MQGSAGKSQGQSDSICSLVVQLSLGVEVAPGGDAAPVNGVVRKVMSL